MKNNFLPSDIKNKYLGFYSLLRTPSISGSN